MNRSEFNELTKEAAQEIALRIHEKDLSLEETQKRVKSALEMIFGGYLLEND